MLDGGDGEPASGERRCAPRTVWNARGNRVPIDAAIMLAKDGSVRAIGEIA